MLTEFRNDRITDMQKTVYPPKTRFVGGITETLFISSLKDTYHRVFCLMLYDDFYT